MIKLIDGGSYGKHFLNLIRIVFIILKCGHLGDEVVEPRRKVRHLSAKCRKRFDAKNRI